MNNPYINTFATESGYTEYIEGSIAKAPNVAYIKGLDEMRYVKVLPTEEYIIYGTTTGTTDFYVGSSSDLYAYPSASNGIHLHVVESMDGGDNIFYAKQEDVVGNIKYFFGSNNGFNTTEGQKITSIKKWTCDTSNVIYFSQMFKGCSSLKSLDLSLFDTTSCTTMYSMFEYCSSLNKFYIGPDFFNSTSITNYDMFTQVSAWTDADSIEQFVQAAEVHDGTGKTIDLSTETLNAMTQAQKDRITGAGWTLQ